MKNILKCLMIIMLVGCSKQNEEVKKANVHLYSYEGVSVKAVVSKTDYNKIIRLEITENSTEETEDNENLNKLEDQRRSIEDFVRSVEDSQLVLADSDPDTWIMSDFFNVRLSEEVKTTDNDFYVFLVKYVIDFEHESAQNMCCGYNDVIDYFGLNNAIHDGKLLLDRLQENKDFIYYETLVAENGLYITQIED